MKKLAAVLGFALFITLYTVVLFWFWDGKYAEMGERVDTVIAVNAERDRSMEDMVELHRMAVVRIAVQERKIERNSDFAKKVVVLWLQVVETSQTMMRIRELHKGLNDKAEHERFKRITKEEK